jgi:hypothetical protein
LADQRPVFAFSICVSRGTINPHPWPLRTSSQVGDVTEFLVDLGNGTFLNDEGQIVQGVVTQRAPVYTTPGGYFPVDPSAWRDTANHVAEALKDMGDPSKGGKTLANLGVTDDVLKLLGTAADIASTVAMVTGVLGVAVKMLAALDLLKFGPSALETLITERFDRLQRQVKALEEQATKRDIRDRLVTFSQGRDDTTRYNETESRGGKGNFAGLEAKRTEVSEALKKVLHADTWLATFDPDDYKDPDLVPLLFEAWFSSSDGQLHRYRMPPAMGNRFDHRLLVPVATYGVQTYLLVCKTVVPELRSSRTFREEIVEAALGLMALTNRMRDETLALTHMDPAAPWFPLKGDTSFPFASPSPPSLAMRLGALDLCGDTAYQIAEARHAAAVAEGAPWSWPTRFGTIVREWYPPAILEPTENPYAGEDGESGWYRVTNYQECADAYNEASEREFTKTLALSGYLHLVQLTALLRLHATDPDRSETVSGQPSTGRLVTKSSPTVASSPSILFTGVIEEPAATRVEQRFSAALNITTQPLERERMLDYRVFLRTLASPTFNDVVDETPYTHFYDVSYEPDPENPDFQRLRSGSGPSYLVGEVDLLHSIGATAPRKSSPESVSGTGVAELVANTYDWYVPERPLPWLSEDAGFGARARAGAIARQAPPQPGLMPSLPQGDVNPTKWVPWQAEPPMEQAQGRHPRHEMVRLHYTFAWHENRMRIELESEPTNRNYVVFFVVEETLWSGAILHSAFRVAVNTALTYVPQSFFIKEQEAYEHTRKTLRDAAIRHTKIAEVEPGEEQEYLVRPGDLRSLESMRETVERIRSVDPALLEIGNLHVR